MLKVRIVITLLFFSQYGIAQNPNPSASVDNYILDEMEAENAPGMSTLIVKGGEIVWLNHYGFADLENNVTVSDSTAFMLASISKVFTGTALMHLRQSTYFYV